MGPTTPPLELISSIASSVAFNCDCSTAHVTPVWENSTPTRHGASVFSLELMSLTQTIKMVATLRQIAGNSNRHASAAKRLRRLRTQPRRAGFSRNHQPRKDRRDTADMVPGQSFAQPQDR